MSATKIEKILQIEGMSCQNCVKRVKKVLAEDTSVENIEVDLNAGNAKFLCQADTDVTALIEALSEYDFSAKE